jgi:hypothetical protein
MEPSVLSCLRKVLMAMAPPNVVIVPDVTISRLAGNNNWKIAVSGDLLLNAFVAG